LRLRFSIIIFLLIGCAKKVPPPGKGEFDPPRVVVFSPGFGDTLKGSFRLSLEAQDNSGVYKVEIFRGGNLMGVYNLRGKKVVLDTLINLTEEGEVYLPDTIQIKVFDRWDNENSLKVEVLTRRKPPQKEGKDDKGTGNEGGEDSGGKTPPKSP
jgi:hypothetical protein